MAGAESKRLSVRSFFSFRSLQESKPHKNQKPGTSDSLVACKAGRGAGRERASATLTESTSGLGDSRGHPDTIRSLFPRQCACAGAGAGAPATMGGRLSSPACNLLAAPVSPSALLCLRVSVCVCVTAGMMDPIRRGGSGAISTYPCKGKALRSIPIPLPTVFASSSTND